MKKMKRIGRDRCTLHRNHLADFKQWLEDYGGFIIVGATKHPYEVLRVRLYSRSGDEPDMFFYRRDRHEHITVPPDMVKYVRKFLNERKAIKAERRTVDLAKVDIDESGDNHCDASHCEGQLPNETT